MSRLAAVQENRPKKPPRVMIYGVPGIGKSSFGAMAPKSIFITPEGGVDEIAGAKVLPNINTYDDVVEGVNELITGKHEYGTLVMDSADWIEKLCQAKIIGNQKSIVTANGGYGAGFSESEKLHAALIKQLETLREKRNMNIIITAHSQVKMVKDPEAIHDYECYDTKMHEKVSSLWREWVDAVLFARYKTYVKKVEEGSDDKARALGTGERIVYTEERPSFKAKNRYGLPPEMNFTKNFWNEFMIAAGKGDKGELERVKAELLELLKRVKDEDPLAPKIKESIQKAGTDPANLMVIVNRLRDLYKGDAA